MVALGAPYEPFSPQLVSPPTEVRRDAWDGLRGLTAFEFVAAVGTTAADASGAELLTARLLLLDAALTGLTRGALDLAVRYAGERRQFGQLIGTYGEIQALLGRIAAQVSAMTDTVTAAADEWDAGRRPLVRAAKATMTCTVASIESCDRAQHAFGGWGHMAEFPVGRFVRDARAVGAAAGEYTEFVDVVAADLDLPVRREDAAA